MVSTAKNVTANVEQILAKIRNFSHQVQSPAQTQQKMNVSAPRGFDSIIQGLKQSLTQVNKTQNEAENLRAAYIKGDPEVSLSKILVSSAQSQVAFEGLLAVRRHFIDAYKEVMNMPV